MSNTAPDTIDSETGEVIKIQDAAAFASQHDSALLDVQVSTAKAYPRARMLLYDAARW